MTIDAGIRVSFLDGPPRPSRLPALAAARALVRLASGCGSGGGGGDHASSPDERSPVARENDERGSDGWQFWLHGYAHGDDATEQVKAYASSTSIDHGDAITFFVSVNPPQPFSIDVYRIGWYGGLGGRPAHEHGDRLLASKAFLSVGHDEYWSDAMYGAAEQAREAGVNLGFFGANEVHWQVPFAPSASGRPDRLMIGYKDAALDPVYDATTTVKWRDPPVDRPEQPLVGLQFGDIIQLGFTGTYADYVVQNSAYWIYAGTGFVDGDVVPGVVGSETEIHDSSAPLPEQREASWLELSSSPYVNFPGPPSHASSAIYRAPSGAWVFAAGTIGWSLGLDDFGARAAPDGRLQRTTRNIVDRFSE